jgi:hypothetical protein
LPEPPGWLHPGHSVPFPFCPPWCWKSVALFRAGFIDDKWRSLSRETPGRCTCRVPFSTRDGQATPHRGQPGSGIARRSNRAKKKPAMISTASVCVSPRFHRGGFSLLSDALRPAGFRRWRLPRRRALSGRGSSDIASPKATIAAIEPAMLYLAAWYALSGIVFLVLGFGTGGRSLEELDQILEKSPRGQSVQIEAQG